MRNMDPWNQSCSPSRSLFSRGKNITVGPLAKAVHLSNSFCQPLPPDPFHSPPSFFVFFLSFGFVFVVFVCLFVSFYHPPLRRTGWRVLFMSLCCLFCLFSLFLSLSFFLSFFLSFICLFHSTIRHYGEQAGEYSS